LQTDVMKLFLIVKWSCPYVGVFSCRSMCF
jgi:hypothetical protein